ncbi:hypothetical protein D3C74_283270 [compost metagenome]
MSRFWHVRSARTATLLSTCIVLLGISTTSLVICLIRLDSGSWPSWVTGFLDSAKNIVWANNNLIAVAVGVAILGLLLFIVALVPGKHSTALLEWDSVDEQEEWVADNRGLANLARYEAERTDGVGSASPTLRGKKLHVSVFTPVHETSDISQSVQANVQKKLSAIPLAHSIRVSVKATTRGGQ